MITIQKPIPFPHTYPLDRIGRIEDLLFFDIETTGFSGDYSNLYLIGCTYYKNNTWNLIQWFADTADSEESLLHAFFKFLTRYSVLIHFNGDGFDIPYLLKRCRHYGLPYDFTTIDSFDIYRKIKPYKNLLGLDSLKQKSIEHYLGVTRLDQYSGGQLIQVYQDYLITHENFLYDMLILHNEDDLKGMPSILPILNYPDFLEHDFTLLSQEQLEYTDIFGDPHPQLLLTCQSRYSIPVPFGGEQGPFSYSASSNRLVVTVSLYDGILKYFYANYKEYYYLVYEDTAVHKSIGEYVDKEARTKATAKTCYTKKAGCFLPQPSLIFEPALRREHKDKLTYVEFQETLLEDPVQLCAYLQQMIAIIK